MEVEVAIPSPLAQTFTYLSDRPVGRGVRAMVPFGPRKVVGVVLNCSESLGNVDRKFKLKNISSVIDDTPVYSEVLLKLAAWMSEYYMFPIGEVLRTMLPASTSKSVQKTYELTEFGQGEISAEQQSTDIEKLASIFGKRKSLTEATLKKKLKALQVKNSEGFLKAQIKLKTLSYASDKKTVARKVSDESDGSYVGDEAGDKTHRLTDDQVSALSLLSDVGLKDDSDEKSSKKPVLLKGVTGCGKTEIYLNFITETQKFYAENDSVVQTLVMVPEISLTPQMTYVFEARFPNQVAVVHSAMTDTDRWKQLDRIRSGSAKILIGPRSAVFAAFQNLKLIIVDEEHDGSYKQTTGLCYHGRDVAVLRGRMEDACVILGSATPSLESYANAMSEKYHLIEITKRVENRPLPSVEAIVAKSPSSQGFLLSQSEGKSYSSDGVGKMPVDQEIISAIKQNLADGNQAIVLVNRRGYAYYLFDLKEKKPYLCPDCSISMTLHARSTVLQCHYCDRQVSVEKVQKDNPDAKFAAIGYGSQKAEDCLSEMLPEARIVRVDSDVVADREKLPTILKKFRNRETDLLVGTQMLAKGHDFPKVTLIAILEVDQLLNLPDFRAGERTFQLMVQAAGRAGRAELPGRVLIQCSKLEHPVIQAGMAQDYQAFVDTEIEFRRAFSYPPFGKLILIEYNSEKPADLSRVCDQIEHWLELARDKNPKTFSRLKILGPTVPSIERIRRRHRRTLLFSSTDLKVMRSIVLQLLATFKKLPTGMRVKVDVDPQSLI